MGTWPRVRGARSQFCQPGKKFELHHRYTWKVLDGFKPRSNMVLLKFSRHHSRCWLKDRVQGTRIGVRGKLVRRPLGVCVGDDGGWDQVSQEKRRELDEFGVQIGHRMNKICWWDMQVRDVGSKNRPKHDANGTPEKNSYFFSEKRSAFLEK